MWTDRVGRRRHNDESYDAVEAELARERRPEKLVYCSKCRLPISASLGINQHEICPETTSNQDGR